MTEIPTIKPYLDRGLTRLCIAQDRAWLESPEHPQCIEGEGELHVFVVDLKRECEHFTKLVGAGNEFSISRVATMAGVSTRTIQNWEAGGVLAGAKRVGDKRRFSRVDLFCAWLIGGLKRAGVNSPRAFGALCLFLAGLDRPPDQAPTRKKLIPAEVARDA